MSVDRLRKIRAEIREFSTRSPTSDTDGLFWYSVDRNYPDYYRLARMGDDTRPLYDVWADVKAEFDRAGMLQVTCEAVLYNVRVDVEEARSTVFDRGFDGNNQPLEQTFLNNMPVYRKKLQEFVDQFVEAAEMYAEEDEKVTA